MKNYYIEGALIKACIDWNFASRFLELSKDENAFFYYNSFTTKNLMYYQ